MQSNNTKVFAQTKWGLKVVGIVLGRTYEKKLKSTGVLHSPPAVCLSCDELDQARALGADFLRVVLTDTNETLSIDLKLFRDYGFPVVRGFGPQIGCRLDRFERTSKIAPRNAVTDNPVMSKSKEYKRPQAQQLPLIWLLAGDEREK